MILHPRCFAPTSKTSTSPLRDIPSLSWSSSRSLIFPPDRDHDPLPILRTISLENDFLQSARRSPPRPPSCTTSGLQKRSWVPLLLSARLQWDFCILISSTNQPATHAAAAHSRAASSLRQRQRLTHARHFVHLLHLANPLAIHRKRNMTPS